MSREDKIQVIVFEVGKEPELRTIENELKPLKEIVQGYIETFLQPNGLIIICNEEGKLIGLPINRIMFNEPIAGNFLMCRSNGEEFASVTKEDITKYIK